MPNNSDKIEDRFLAFSRLWYLCPGGVQQIFRRLVLTNEHRPDLHSGRALRCFDACWCLHPCTFTLDQVLNHLKNNLNPAHGNLFWQINAGADQIPKQQLLHAAHRDYYPVKLNLCTCLTLIIHHTSVKTLITVKTLKYIIGPSTIIKTCNDLTTYLSIHIWSIGSFAPLAKCEDNNL